MSARRVICCLVVAGLMAGVAHQSARASGFRLAGQDAFATARGEAFVATADDPSAVYYNPAGITQLEGLNFRAGAAGIYFDPNYKPAPPSNTNWFDIDDKWAAAGQSFSTWTPRDWPVSFGLGIYSPYGGDISWPEDTGFRSVALEGSLTYVTVNPVVALQLAPGLSIAGGLMMSYANLETEQGLIATAQPLANYFRFEGDDWGFGYNAGLLWQPHPQVALGATFRSSVDFTFKGQTHFERQPVIPETERSARADFEFPWTGVLGVSYRPTPKWNIEFNADYTDWSSFGTTTIRQSPAPPFPVQQNVPVTLDWEASWMYELGVTRYFDKDWHVSAGYVFSENSVPDAHYSPLAADMDRHFFSVGVGRRCRPLSWDVAYQFGWGPAHTVSGSSPSSSPALFSGQRADGKYDFISHAVLVTVGLHF